MWRHRSKLYELLGDSSVPLYLSQDLQDVSMRNHPLSSTKVFLEGIGMLLSIDWFLDRLRTSINVWGDSIGAAVVDRLQENFIEKGETL